MEGKSLIWILFVVPNNNNNNNSIYIYIYETTTIFQNIGVQALTFKLTLLEKLKSCINTMESTDTASIQWTIMYRSYQVIVALDV